MGSGLLLLVLVSGAIGIALLVRHILIAFQHEPAAHRTDDIALLSERTLQWLTAGVAFWAIRQRRPLGRWLTAALCTYLSIKVLLGFRGALQAAFGQRDAVSRIPFSTPVEGVVGILFAAVVAFVLMAIAFSMAFNPQVRAYFASDC